MLSGTWAQALRELTVARFLLDQWLPLVEGRDLKESTKAAYQMTVTSYVVPRIGHVPWSRSPPWSSNASSPTSAPKAGPSATAASPPRPAGTSTASSTRPSATPSVTGSSTAIGPILHLLLLTGARRGELVALLWDDIDLDTGTLDIRRSAVVVPGRGAEVAQRAADLLLGTTPPAT